jgi:hypothetical protein
MHVAALVAFVIATACSQHDSCDDVVDELTECYDDMCAGSSAGSPFCNCWDQGQSFDLGQCTCMARDFEAECQAWETLSKYAAIESDCKDQRDGSWDICPRE